jgi:hypothetical protein
MSNEQPISEVYALIVDLCLANGGRSIKDLPGCFTLRIGRAFIAINGHMEEKSAESPDGVSITVTPFGGAMFWNGWPVYMGDPFGGQVIGLTEDDLIEKIKSLSNETNHSSVTLK